MTNELLRTFWVSLLAAAFLCVPVFRLLLKLNSRQTVSQYAPETHQKKQGTPTMGGLIIVGGSFLALCLETVFNPGLSPVLVLMAGYAAIGFIDDFVVPRMMVGKRGLGWKQKIAMQFVLAIIAAVWARGAVDLTAGWLVFLILFYSNAYNFSDGLDGLAGSLLLAFSAGFLVIGFLAGVSTSTLIPVVALAGAVIPFLFLNAPPAKIFMGDVGSLPVGAVLGYSVGLVSIVGIRVRGTGWLLSGGSPLPGAATAWLLAGLVVLSGMMVVELVPVPLQILSVKLRKKKIFPYTPIHHAFERAGWPETRVVWHFALAQVVLSMLAVALVAQSPEFRGVADERFRTTMNR